MYCYLQIKGGEDVWQECLASQRAEVLKSKSPRYMTVLDLSELVTDSTTREQMAQVRYRGPFYADWDAENTDTAIAKVQEFADKLEGMGFDLSEAYWFATGGRGFHCEIPAEVFMEKVNPKGLPNLFAIYKELAFQVYTDCMDMRVYSGRKGRMWRSVNVLRENGAYKVAITPAELKAMTPELYKELCAAPRAVLPGSKPTFNSNLGILYAKAAQRVDQAVKRKKSEKKDLTLLNKFKGKFPPSLERIMRGEGLAADAGFHQIAMQIAITSNALGQKEDAVLAQCEGLIANHTGDGVRYNTPRKRRDELARMLRYTDTNVCYSYSPGAVKNLVARSEDTSDLDGMLDTAGDIIAGGPVLGEDDVDDGGMTSHLQMRTTGLYKRGEDGLKRISGIAFQDTCVMWTFPEKQKDSEIWGYEAEVLRDGKSHGRHTIPMNIFTGRARYNEFALRFGGQMVGGDMESTLVSKFLIDQAEKNNRNVWVWRQEGLALIQDPTNAKQLDLVWFAPSGVRWNRPENCPYIFRSAASATGLFCSDLLSSPQLTEGDSAQQEVINSLLFLHETKVLGPMLGWMVSAFHHAIYMKFYAKFPLLHAYGQSGSGKTHTLNMLVGMHYYQHSQTVTLNTGSSSAHVIESLIGGSSSIPVFLDELNNDVYKRKDLKLPTTLRSVYDGSAVTKGGGKDDTSSNYRELSVKVMSAPVMYAAEAMVSETAVMSRSVVVPVNKTNLNARKKQYDSVTNNMETLAALGRSILAATFDMDLEKFKQQMAECDLEVRAVLGERAEPRATFNGAVVYMGLNFLQDVLYTYFGDTFDARIKELKEGVLKDHKEASTGNTRAEASKVLADLSYITNHEDSGKDFALREGVDYGYVTVAGQERLELNMEVAFTRYKLFCKWRGDDPLFADALAFTRGLTSYDPCVERNSLSSALRPGGSAIAKIARFDVEKLLAEEVEPFKRTR